MTKKELTSKEFRQLLDPIGFGVFQDWIKTEDGKDIQKPHTYIKKTIGEDKKEIEEEKTFYKTRIVNQIEVEGKPVNVAIDVLTHTLLDWKKVQGSFMDLENNPILNKLPEKLFIKTAFKNKETNEYVPLKAPTIKTSIWLDNQAVKDLEFKTEKKKEFKKSM